MRFLKNFLLSIVIIILPLHSVASVAMSCCLETSMTATHCAHQRGESRGPAASQNPAEDSGLSGNISCGICYLAGVGMAPMGNVRNGAETATEKHAVPPAPTFFSAVTKPLIRPPRLT